MKHFKHPACNDVLRAEPGTEDRVDDLQVYRHIDTFGDTCVASFWRPSPRELEALNANGCVMFAAMGETHPPVLLSVLAGNRVIEDNA